MKRKNIITIANNGEVSIPTTVTMRDFEIAELLGVMLPTVKGKIKTLLKVRPTMCCSGGIVMGNSIIPEYFGLDMINAIAFQVDSYQAEILRDYILSRLTTPSRQPIYVQIGGEQILN